MNYKSTQGQSTLEYIILVTAVIAVAIFFLKPSSGGKLFDTVEKSYNDVADGMNTVAGKLKATFGN